MPLLNDLPLPAPQFYQILQNLQYHQDALVDKGMSGFKPLNSKAGKPYGDGVIFVVILYFLFT